MVTGQVPDLHAAVCVAGGSVGTPTKLLGAWHPQALQHCGELQGNSLAHLRRAASKAQGMRTRATYNLEGLCLYCR